MIDVYKRQVQRVDHEDLVYRTIQAKYNAVADDVEQRHAKGQPVLVGTVSIESSEKLSAALTKRGIAHEVLNAKHHEREAHIVAQAGRYGAVTIATNMAGRGTDILLGGNPDELVRERLEYALSLIHICLSRYGEIPRESQSESMSAADFHASLTKERCSRADSVG